MEDIILKKIRTLLVDLAFVSADDLQKISDEDFLKKSFEQDFGLDSLDYLLLIEKMKNDDYLSVLGNDVWDCRTVKELVAVFIKK